MVESKQPKETHEDWQMVKKGRTTRYVQLANQLNWIKKYLMVIKSMFIINPLQVTSVAQKAHSLGSKCDLPVVKEGKWFDSCTLCVKTYAWAQRPCSISLCKGSVSISSHKVRFNCFFLLLTFSVWLEWLCMVTLMDWTQTAWLRTWPPYFHQLVSSPFKRLWYISRMKSRWPPAATECKFDSNCFNLIWAQ